MRLAAEALSREEAAKKGGVNTQTPTVRYVNGVPTSSTAEKDIGFAGVPTPQPGITTSLSGTPDDVYKLIDSIKNPQDRANMRDGYARQIANLGAGTGNSSAPSLPQQMPGIVSNANVANEASAKTMHDSYAKLQASNSAANSALDGINKMQGLAANKNPLLQSGPLMAGPMRTLQTSVSTDAAEYEKQRANLISMLSAQNGTNGTDAGRALTGDSVPDFGKPKDAIKDGLTTLKNQTMVQQLKSQFLTPSYQSGDSKTYTQKEGEFDRNISPSMMSLITMPAGQSRAMLLQSAAKDPAMRAKLEWAMQNGMLK